MTDINQPAPPTGVIPVPIQLITRVKKFALTLGLLSIISFITTSNFMSLWCLILCVVVYKVGIYLYSRYGQICSTCTGITYIDAVLHWVKNFFYLSFCCFCNDRCNKMLSVITWWNITYFTNIINHLYMRIIRWLHVEDCALMIK